MTGPLDDAWEYLKKAPLGVVLSVSLSCTAFSVGYTAKVSSEDRAAARAAETAARHAEQTSAVAASNDAAALETLSRVEALLRDLTVQVTRTNTLLLLHLDADKVLTPRDAEPRRR